MKPEILLKAYVEYQSEDAFRDLVAGTLNGVYASSLRIVPDAPHLAEEIALSAYAELARKAPELGEDVVLASWLRERECKLAVRILRAEDRAIDWAALKREKAPLLIPAGAPPAPRGLAIRICRTIFLNPARYQRPAHWLPRIPRPAWLQPFHVPSVAACVLVLIVWWSLPSHRRNPIVRSQASLLTPSAFAQRASPEEGEAPMPGPLASTNVATNPDPK